MKVTIRLWKGHWYNHPKKVTKNCKLQTAMFFGTLQKFQSLEFDFNICIFQGNFVSFQPFLGDRFKKGHELNHREIPGMIFVDVFCWFHGVQIVRRWHWNVEIDLISTSMRAIGWNIHIFGAANKGYDKTSRSRGVIGVWWLQKDICWGLLSQNTLLETTRWWQLKYFLLHPENWGRWTQFWQSYFWKMGWNSTTN